MRGALRRSACRLKAGWNWLWPRSFLPRCSMASMAASRCMIKGQSKFGAELDSLADFVNFRRRAVGVDRRIFGSCTSCIMAAGSPQWSSQSAEASDWRDLTPRSTIRIETVLRGEFRFTGVPAPAGAIVVLLPIYLAFLGLPKPPAMLTRSLYAADRFPDGFCACLCVLRQDRSHARAARNGAAGLCIRGFIHRAVDRLSLVYSVGRHGALSSKLARGVEILPRPSAQGLPPRMPLPRVAGQPVQAPATPSDAAHPFVAGVCRDARGRSSRRALN